MKQRLISVFLCIHLLLMPGCLHALSRSEAEEFAHKGDQHFGEKEWEAAVANYQQALSFGQSPQLYYNLGQTYTQLRKPGHALAYFLQAEKIKPRWTLLQQATKQLYAENSTLAPVPFPWYHSLFQLFTLSTWKWIAAILFWMAVAFLGKSRIRKNKTYQIIGSSNLLLFAGLTLVLFLHRPYNTFGILPEVTVGHYAPNAKSPTRYQWPTGTACWIKSEVADFYFVSTMRGEDGWVKKSELISLP